MGERVASFARQQPGERLSSGHFYRLVPNRKLPPLFNPRLSKNASQARSTNCRQRSSRFGIGFPARCWCRLGVRCMSARRQRFSKPQNGFSQSWHLPPTDLSFFQDQPLQLNQRFGQIARTLGRKPCTQAPAIMPSDMGRGFTGGLRQFPSPSVSYPGFKSDANFAFRQRTALKGWILAGVSRLHLSVPGTGRERCEPRRFCLFAFFGQDLIQPAVR